MKFVNLNYPPGSPGQREIHLYLGCMAAEEFPEFQWQRTAPEQANSIHQSIAANWRVERIAYTDWGLPVGILILTEDDDMHVGRCLSVQWQYVLPEYRNAGIAHQFMRTAIQLARQEGYPVLAYSHRVGPGEYSIKYRRINGKENQKGRQGCS